jgi:hypothetical protein
MQELGTSRSNATRSLRAGVAVRETVFAEDRRRDGSRTRRGSLTAESAVWRRTEMGTNHIACFGVWRTGTRRQAERLNRTGQTRWHMPHQGGAVILPGAVDEAANEN